MLVRYLVFFDTDRHKNYDRYSILDTETTECEENILQDCANIVYSILQLIVNTIIEMCTFLANAQM